VTLGAFGSCFVRWYSQLGQVLLALHARIFLNNATAATALCWTSAKLQNQTLKRAS
jgi:hypothetical protein